MTNLIFYIAVLVILVLGVLAGFNRFLKFYFKGFFGFLVSIFLCVVLGGMIRSIPMVAGWITSLNNLLTEKAKFLANWGAIVIYYIALFIVITIIKAIFTNMLIRLFSSKNGFMRVINKLLGIVFFAAMTLLFIWLILHILDMIDNGKIVDGFYDYLASKKEPILIKIFKWNPIKELFGI